MSIFSLRRTSTPIGLDIGTNTFRAVQLKGNHKIPLLTQVGSINIPRGAIEEGEIIDVVAVSESLRELWKKLGLRQRQVIIGVANQKVIVRLVELPYTTEDELRSALRYQAQEYIAIPIEEAILDFQILGEFTTEEDERMMEVLLVAGQKDMIQTFIDTLQGADLEPEAIDVSSFALVRSLTEKPPLILEEGDVEEATVLMNIGAGITNIVVVERGLPRFTRVTSMAGNNFTEAVADSLGIALDEAERLKIEVGLPSVELKAPEKNVDKLKRPKTTKYLKSPKKPEPSEAKTKSKKSALVQEALANRATQFADEIRRSLDYYLTQAKVAGIQNVIITGSGAKLNNFGPFLEKMLQAKVEYGRPLQKAEIAPALENIARDEELSLAISLGLALRGVEE